MKTLQTKFACVFTVCVSLLWPGITARGQISTNLFTFDTTDTGGTWANWQTTDLTLAYDTSQDHTGNGGGSLYWYLDNSGGTGAQLFNCWGGNPYWSGSPAQYIDLSTATNISFWVKWDTSYSTLGIDFFNNSSGPSGIPVGIETGSSYGLGTQVGTAIIPDAASNGWALVNVPLTPGSAVDENLAIGIGFNKWIGTPSQTGIFAFWIDDIQAQYPGELPPEIMKNPMPPGAQGLNLYEDGNSGNRQSIKTVVTSANGLNYGWVGNGSPVTYSAHIAAASSPEYLGGQFHMMICPATDISETAPDWNETNALVLFVVRQTNGVIGQLRYKLNNQNNNSYLFGSDTNIYGGNGMAFTNTMVAGYGGLLGSVTNVGGYVGTWSIQMTSDTDITLTSPDGSHNSFAFPQLSDAQAFAGPVTVYWGVQPNSANRFQDTVLDSVSITGSPNTLNANLTQPLNPDLLAVSAATPSIVFSTPTNAVYWLQWAPPNPNFVLQSAASVTGPWTNVQGVSVTLTNYMNTLGTSNYITSGRNWNPPPVFIGYDFGEDTAATEDWMAGPTYDAGGDAGSGSIQFKWTWSGVETNQGFVMDVFASGQNLSGGTLSFDIMIDSTSMAGTNSDYGYFDVVSRDDSYGWNPVLSESLLTAAGGTTGTWSHVTIPLGTGAASTVRALNFVFSNNGAINGTQAVYLDNLQLTAPTGTAPKVYNINATSSTYITEPMMPSGDGGFFRLLKQ